jgi:integrase
MGTSYQKGWVRLRGKKWYGNFRRTVIDPETNEPKTVISPVVLGLKSEMSKSEAREKLEGEIARLTGQPTADGVVKNGTVTFGWFVRNRFLPLKEADWRAETAKVKKYLIQADLVDSFDDVRLEDFDKFSLQTHLNQLGKTRSKDRVLQIRSYMRSIFAEAVDQGYLLKDPARKVKTPANLRPVDKTTLTWENLWAALDQLELRDWILLKLEMSNALRPSELFGLRWKTLRPELPGIRIEETTYKGKIRPYGKTEGSLTTISIAPQLMEELLDWQRECRKGGKDTSADAFIFAGRHGGFMDYSNYRKRVLHKLAKELGLPRLNFQIIRRTMATLAQDVANPKNIQGMMRHKRLATTTEVYIQQSDTGVRSTINLMHDRLMEGFKKGLEPGPVASSTIQ